MTASRPIHQMLVPFSVAYLTAAFVTDLAYWRTAEVMWERFCAASCGINPRLDVGWAKRFSA